MTKIILTGGGTAGHVMGNLAILPGLLDRGFQVGYIGSKNGIERELIQREGLPYWPIASGKLRRFFSFKNLTDAFRVAGGVFDALRILGREKPDLIFSKGGYVSVPVALAARIKRIPFIGHESDITPGLANRLASRFADKMLVTFPETRASFGDKGLVVGSPVRPELLTGSAQAGRQFLGFSEDKPVLLVMGGSLGSERLNRALRESLASLLKEYQIVHLVGKGNHLKEADRPGYVQLEYVADEMKDVLAAAEFVVSRAGSNSIFEFLALGIPNLLIPLDYDQSRGDQVLNAQSFEKQGYSMVLREKDLNQETLLHKLAELKAQGPDFKRRMASAQVGGAVEKMLAVIDESLKKSRTQT